MRGGLGQGVGVTALALPRRDRAGVSALVLAAWLGLRTPHPVRPHNVPFVVLGGTLLL